MSEVQFSPAQLDALEDALEELESLGVPESLHGDDAVVTRLDAYREILAMSREAMPLEDVPTGLLDGVMAEAHESVALPVVEPSDDDEAAAAPWWARWRAVLVPGFAVAATAALVLIVVRLDAPQEGSSTVAMADDQDKAAAKHDTPAAADRLAAAAEDDQSAADRPFEVEAERGQAAMASDAEPVPVDEEEGVPEPPAPDEAPNAIDAVDEKSGGAEQARIVAGLSEDDADKQPFATKTGDRKAASGGGPAKPKASSRARKESPRPAEPKRKPKAELKPEPEPSVTPTPKPEAAFDGQASIRNGDRMRNASNCGGAQREYNLAAEDDDASIRARALAGLGLCSLASGDDAAAERYFSRAIAEDGSVRTFIKKERGRLESKRPKAKKAPPQQQQAVPQQNANPSYDSAADLAEE